MSQTPSSQMQDGNVVADDALKALEKAIHDANTLLTELKTNLEEIHRLCKARDIVVKPSEIDDAPAAPDGAPSVYLPSLVNISASLIIALVNKLSLFIVTEPFTPSAITTVVRELSDKPLGGLGSAVAIIASPPYPQDMGLALASKSVQIVRGLGELLSKIPFDGKVVPVNQRTGSAPPGLGGRGTLVSTALVMQFCNDLVCLTEGGIRGYYVGEIEKRKNLLVDIKNQLREWGDESAQDDANLELSDNFSSLQNFIDDFMKSYETIPLDDPNRIRPRLEMSLKRLRLVINLHNALIKRRLKRMPDIFIPTTPKASIDPISTRLDAMTKSSAMVFDNFEMLASGFLQLDSEQIDTFMDKCLSSALTLSELFARDWSGRRDDFSPWIDKFQHQMRGV